MEFIVNRESLIRLIVEHAISHLEYDDAHPDVGMGMIARTAFELACEDVINESKRWDRIITIDFKNIEDECIELIRQRRR